MKALELREIINAYNFAVYDCNEGNKDKIIERFKKILEKRNVEFTEEGYAIYELKEV